MVPGFAIRGGTVAGRHHAQAGRNNQDAFAWRQGERALVAAVCDGCSSGAHSEVGARLGCELIVQALFEESGAGQGDGPLEALAKARDRVLGELSRLAGAMGGAAPGTPAFLEVVAEHFLFTVVGAAIVGERAFAFTLGDGALCVNGVLERLGPYPDNAPPYLAYALAGRPALALDFRPLPTPERIDSLLLATDGAAGLDLAPLAEDPRVVANPDMVRRLIWRQGRQRLLEDDATVLVVRRAP